jgi:hypothetical protein
MEKFGMVDDVAFYNQQAENCAKLAAEAVLENERQKFLAAQTAWRSLATSKALWRSAAVKREGECRHD